MDLKKLYLKLFSRQRYTRYKKLCGHKREYENWVARGRHDAPPHIVKQMLVRENGRVGCAEMLVETGTYRGDMVEAMRSRFSRVFSIELDTALYEKACTRFQEIANVIILQGDSGTVLSQLLKDISVKGLFWLDGHYSGGVTARGEKETPILSELRTIASHKVKNHIILIDDARLFAGKDDYPDLPSLTRFMTSIDPHFSIEIHDDVIFIRRDKGECLHSGNLDIGGLLENDLKQI